MLKLAIALLIAIMLTFFPLYVVWHTGCVGFVVGYYVFLTAFCALSLAEKIVKAIG